MVEIPVAFRSNKGRYNFIGTASLTNAHAEQMGPDAKAVFAVIPSDGSVSFSTVTDTPCRGAIYLEDQDYAISVHSSSVYKVLSTGVATRLGTIPGIDRVRIVRNQKSTPQIVVRCDVGCYVIESDAISKITDEDLPSVIDVESIAGYIVYAVDDGRFFISSINEVTEIDALDFAEAEQGPDGLLRVIAIAGELLLMGSNTIEPWVNTGNADFPFELRSSASVIPKGILARHSAVKIDNSVMWVGNDRMVYRLNGYNALRISTPEIEDLIDSDENQEDISAFTYAKNGHEFYCLTGTDWTACYDASTQIWVHRESYQSDRWRHDHSFSAWGMVIVGDRNSGSLYYLDRSTYTEAGDPMIFEVVSPPMKVFPNGGIIDALHFDMLTGQGDVLASSQGFDPTLMISLSKDGGNTFGHERQYPLGKSGNYEQRIVTRKWGKVGPRGAVIKLAISDPVGRSVALTDAQVRPLKR